VSRQKSLRVNFLLPYEMNLPVGGYKVVYQYSNELVARGHDIRVILPKNLEPRTDVSGEIKNLIWPRVHKLRNPKGITWFPLDPRVQIVLAADLREKWLPEADFSIATFWKTAPFAHGYSERMGKKVYLIQHLETWAGPEADVVNTWKLPLKKIVIAKWLASFADSLGEKCTYIPNGIDFNEYGVDVPIDKRSRRIAMMYNPDFIKGAWDGINALELIHEKYPDVTVVLFGVAARPFMLPLWIQYVQNATAPQLREIYNSCSIFAHPSWTEGWPLPPAEAMTCGAAIVAAANGGVMDYLTADETALTSRPKYWLEFADRIAEFLDDDEKRIRFATKGSQTIRGYTYKRATDSLENLLLELT